MPKVEIKRKSRLTRQEVADRLIALGNALAGGSEIELSSGGDSIELAVADQIDWELEIEIDGDETELEIELKWRDAAESDGGSAEPEEGEDAGASEIDGDEELEPADELAAAAAGELAIAAELEDDAETRLEIAAELEEEAAAELVVAAALEDDAEVELETAELLEVESALEAEESAEGAAEQAAGEGTEDSADSPGRPKTGGRRRGPKPEARAAD